jgi:uncharacterized protein (TIGR04255 family)
VDQVALAIAFRPLTRLRATHLGLFWRSLNQADRYPVVEEYEYSPPYLEVLEPDKVQSPEIAVLLANRPAVPRVVITSRDGQTRIAAQNDLLQVSWRRSGSEAYPRFEQPREWFLHILELFQTFLREHKLGALRIRQADLSYLNRLPRGDLWARPTELSGVVRFTPASGPTLPDIEGMHFAQHHLLRRGEQAWARLYISLDAEVPTEAGPPGAWLSLTVRGPIQNGNDDVLGFLDEAHVVIVTSFVEVTTEAAHRAWGRLR